MTTITVPKKLNREVKTFIVQAVNEILNDPDFGLRLTTNAKKRLRSITSAGQKIIPFQDIKRKYY